MVSTITLVCRTIDSIPRRQFTYIPCPLDALLLPLRAIVDADCSYSLPRPLLQATVADFYDYRPNGHFLAPKQSRTEIPFSSNSVTRFRNAVLSGTCVLSPVFAQCIRPSSLCLYNPAHASAILKSSNFFAFRRRLLLSGDDPALCSPRTSCKTFRAQITQRSTVLSVHQQTLSKAAWSRFWRLTLTTVQRNVLYRLLHRLIPTRRILFHILPAKYPSSACEFCGDVEDIYHLFFRCPPKFIFWDHLIREYLWPGSTIDHIFAALSSLDFRSIRILPSCPLSATLLLTIAPSEVWKLHWLGIFEKIPFPVPAAFRNLRLAIQRRHSEDFFVEE